MPRKPTIHSIHMFLRWAEPTAIFIPRGHQSQRAHELRSKSATRLCDVLTASPPIRPGRFQVFPDGWTWIAED